MRHADFFFFFLENVQIMLSVSIKTQFPSLVMISSYIFQEWYSESRQHPLSKFTQLFSYHFCWILGWFRYNIKKKRQYFTTFWSITVSNIGWGLNVFCWAISIGSSSPISNQAAKLCNYKVMSVLTYFGYEKSKSAERKFVRTLWWPLFATVFTWHDRALKKFKCLI